MKKIRSFTSIWSVEKVIYAVNDFKLPFPITLVQMGWFVSTMLLMIVFGDLPPLSFIGSSLLKYGAIPIGVTIFMNRKSFDGKKPFGFIRSFFGYIFRVKLTHGHKAVKLDKQNIDVDITVVRRSEPNEESNEIPD